MPDDLGLFPEAVFDLADEIEEGNRSLASAEIDDLVSGFAITSHRLSGENGAAGDVIDVGEVARLRAIAEDGDGRAFVDPLDEAEGRHVGSSGGTVDGEIAQDGDVEAVEVMVGVGEHLGGFLRRGVG